MGYLSHPLKVPLYEKISSSLRNLWLVDALVQWWSRKEESFCLQTLRCLWPKQTQKCLWIVPEDLNMGTGVPSFLLPIPFLFPSWKETSPSSYSWSLSNLIPVCTEEMLLQDVVPSPPSLPPAGFVKKINLEKREAKERSDSRCE